MFSSYDSILSRIPSVQIKKEKSIHKSEDYYKEWYRLRCWRNTMENFSVLQVLKQEAHTDPGFLPANRWVAKQSWWRSFQLLEFNRQEYCARGWAMPTWTMEHMWWTPRRWKSAQERGLLHERFDQTKFWLEAPWRKGASRRAELGRPRLGWPSWSLRNEAGLSESDGW